MKALCRSLYYHVLWEINFLKGETVETDHLQLDSRYLKIYRKLGESFKDYDPAYRDFLHGMYANKKLVAPEESELIKHAAKWATDVTLTIELMHQGKLPPNTFMPLIEPSEIGYYYERTQEYLEWLFSYDTRENRKPLPFFHMVAAERLSHLIKDQKALVVTKKAVAEAAAEEKQIRRVRRFTQLAFNPC